MAYGMVAMLLAVPAQTMTSHVDLLAKSERGDRERVPTSLCTRGS